MRCSTAPRNQSGHSEHWGLLLSAVYTPSSSDKLLHTANSEGPRRNAFQWGTQPLAAYDMQGYHCRPMVTAFVISIENAVPMRCLKPNDEAQHLQQSAGAESCGTSLRGHPSVDIPL